MFWFENFICHFISAKYLTLSYLLHNERSRSWWTYLQRRWWYRESTKRWEGWNQGRCGSFPRAKVRKRGNPADIPSFKLKTLLTNDFFSRWWFASTAFPLVAGTFGPMASAFSICALVVRWRVSIPPGGVEEHGIYIDDPKWYALWELLEGLYVDTLE